MDQRRSKTVGKGNGTGKPVNDQHVFGRSVLVRFVDLATQALAEERERIDALNVFPVADSDTGTNLYLTLDAARTSLAENNPATLGEALTVFTRGALIGARGNSGVILSQLIGALMWRLGRVHDNEQPAIAFADGMRLAADAAYTAVGSPVEGTMLTVAREAADAAERSLAEGAPLAAVVSASVRGARAALIRTPQQLRVLAEAGVVDAGAYGLCVVLDAVVTALTGLHREPIMVPAFHELAPVGSQMLPVDDLTEGGPAYEVMYLLDADEGFDQSAVGAFRADLAGLGDSVVVGGPTSDAGNLWNIHVHTDDVGAVVERGLEVGRPQRIRVTHFAEQRQRQSRKPRRRVILAYAVGPGLRSLFSDAGAIVIEPGPSGRPGPADFEAAIAHVVHSDSDEVIVLPNDVLGVESARAAARAVANRTGAAVVVVPAQAQVQGIAALAVHEPSRGLDSDVVAMTAAARGTRHGAVTVSTTQAITTVGPCEVGEVLGVLQGDVAVIGDGFFEVAIHILRRMLDAGGELVTLVGGAGAGDLPLRCEAWVASTYPGVDVSMYDGGQPRYPLFLAVE